MILSNDDLLAHFSFFFKEDGSVVSLALRVENSASVSNLDGIATKSLLVLHGSLLPFVLSCLFPLFVLLSNEKSSHGNFLCCQENDSTLVFVL